MSKHQVLCSHPRFSVEAAIERVWFEHQQRLDECKCPIATKWRKKISLTAFRHRSESFRLESITVADSVTYISRLNIRSEAEQQNIVP